MIISQAVFRRKAGPRRERAPAWHRASTRKAILDTARELFAANGTENTSLTEVAERAGFAPPTVYAYFVRKADLIAAIVADDLSCFARKIEEGFPFSEREEEEEPEIDEEVAEPHAVDAIPAVDEAQAAPKAGELQVEVDHAWAAASIQPIATADTEKEKDTDTEIFSSETTAAHEADDFVPSHEIVEAAVDVLPDGNNSEKAQPKLQIDRDVVSALEARMTELEARRADPWLERRLREFERMLASLEERAGSSAETNASDKIEAAILELGGRLEACEKKFAAAIEERASGLAKDIQSRESRFRENWVELRTLALEATGRLEALERERGYQAVAIELPIAQQPETTDTVPATAEAIASEKPTEPSGADESYLAAARRAAMAAQSLARADEKVMVNGVGKRQTWALVGICVGLGLVLTVAGVVLNNRASSSQMPATPVTHSIGSSAHAIVAASVRKPAAIVPVVSTKTARENLAKGLAYLNADGVARDDALASRFLETAALSGQPLAQYWLATLFEHGRGEPVDPAEAIRWYEAAALQGNLKAMYKLAVSYAEGWGARQNYSEAARWFSRAAEFGFVNAQYNLGVLYERGLGVPQSLLDAYKWYALAASQGDKVSASRVDALASQLNANDLATAREAVAAFKPLALDPEANAVPSVSPQAPLSDGTPTAKR